MTSTAPGSLTKSTSSTDGREAGRFVEGSVHYQLSRLTGFMLLGFVAVMGANLVETLYIGSVGTIELAALGFTFPVVMSLQGVTMGLGIGASSVVSRSIGGNAVQPAKILITHSFILVIFFAVILSGSLYALLDTLFVLLGAGDQVLPLAIGYMQIWLLGFPLFAISMVGSSLMRAAGDAVKPSFLITVGAGFQIVLGPIFIFGVAGMPALGLEGAAIAFVFARLVSFVLFSYYLYKDDLFIFRLQGFWRSCKDILHVGLPAILANLISPISMSVITRLLAGHGAVVIAGMSVASRIETMLGMVMWALSMSVAPFIGQNWGARKYLRVGLALKLSNLFALIWGCFSYCILLLLGPYLISLVNSDPEVVAVARVYLMIVPLGMGLMGVVAISTSSFNALGKPAPPLIISALQMLLLSIPFALVGDSLFGYRGIFMGSVLAVLVSASICFIWLRRTISVGQAAGLRPIE